MKHFINIKDIPAKDLRSIIEKSKKRKNIQNIIVLIVTLFLKTELIVNE